MGQARSEGHPLSPAEAYLDSTSSTVTKRNDVDAALSRTAAESRREMRVKPLREILVFGAVYGRRESSRRAQTTSASSADEPGEDVIALKTQTPLLREFLCVSSVSAMN